MLPGLGKLLVGPGHGKLGDGDALTASAGARLEPRVGAAGARPRPRLAVRPPICIPWEP